VLLHLKHVEEGYRSVQVVTSVLRLQIMPEAAIVNLTESSVHKMSNSVLMGVQWGVIRIIIVTSSLVHKLAIPMLFILVPEVNDVTLPVRNTVVVSSTIVNLVEYALLHHPIQVVHCEHFLTKIKVTRNLTYSLSPSYPFLPYHGCSSL